MKHRLRRKAGKPYGCRKNLGVLAPFRQSNTGSPFFPPSLLPRMFMTADDIHIGVIGSLRCSGPPHENPWLNSHHSHLSHHGSAMIRLSFSESNEPTHSDFLFGSCAKFGAAMPRFLLGHGLRLRVLQPQTVQTTSSQGTLAKSTSQGSAFHGLLLLFGRCLHTHTHMYHMCVYIDIL